MKIKNKLIVGLITASLLLCLISPVYASQPLNVLSTSAREGATNCRVAGYDRYQTAIRIAEKLDNVTHIAVVTGEDYADALSIGSVAGKLNMPVILVEKNTLPSSVKSYLASKNITKSYVVGDQDLIGTAVLSQLPNVDIISDYTRYDKNIAILKKFEANFTTDSVCVATGEGFADALTGTAYAAKNSLPIVLLPDTFNARTDNYIYAKRNNLNKNSLYIWSLSNLRR